jgi:hypothetical protein
MLRVTTVNKAATRMWEFFYHDAALDVIVGSSCWPTVKDRCRGFSEGFCGVFDFACVL